MLYEIINGVVNGPQPPIEVQDMARAICELRSQNPWEVTVAQGYSMQRWQAVLVETQLLRALYFRP